MKPNTLFKSLIVGAFAACVCAGGSVKAAVAYSASPVSSQAAVAGYGLSGFQFTLNQNINLTALGFTAIAMGGDAPHVTLWDASAGLGSLVQLYDTGNILGSVTSYDAANLDAVPSYVSVGAPISLTTGKTYLVTAPAYWVATYSPANITVASEFATSAFLTGGGWNGWDNAGYNFAALATPGGNYSATVNFQYTAVPEPSAYLLVGMGVITLAVLRRWVSAKA